MTRKFVERKKSEAEIRESEEPEMKTEGKSLRKSNKTFAKANDENEPPMENDNNSSV